MDGAVTGTKVKTCVGGWVEAGGDLDQESSGDPPQA